MLQLTQMEKPPIPKTKPDLEMQSNWLGIGFCVAWNLVVGDLPDMAIVAAVQRVMLKEMDNNTEFLSVDELTAKTVEELKNPVNGN